MGTVFLAVSTTRCLSIGEVCKWLVRNRIPVQEYLTEKETNNAPSDALRVMIYMVRAVTKPVNIFFRSV